MSKKIFDELFQRYTVAVTASDVDAIIALYAPHASIEIPVGGPSATGIDAIESFYRDNELAESLAVVGPAFLAYRIAPEKAVGVFDGAVLPGRVQVTAEDLHAPDRVRAWCARQSRSAPRGNH